MFVIIKISKEIFLCHNYVGGSMKRNGYSIMELLILIGALGLVVIGVITTTSNAFKDNSEDLYKDKVYLIKHSAMEYGYTLNNLESEGTLIITVDDLINNGFLVGEDGGNTIIDPRNSKATLNGLKLKLIYNGEYDITVEVLEE